MSFRIFDLKTEFATNPIGIGTNRPRFSWKYSHSRSWERSAYFQILVASTTRSLASDRGDLWDSGKVPTSRSPLIEYDGHPLKSRSVGHWKVRLWDSEGTAGDFSAAGSFEVALLEQSDWLANWVGFPAGRPGKALYFRNSYTLDKYGRSGSSLYLRSGLVRISHQWAKSRRPRAGTGADRVQQTRALFHV